jgi:uncharacterized protein YdhG (YjbR/CyaY superfamily)
MSSADIDMYFLSCPAETKDTLEKLRNIIKKAAPKAEELIHYGIPALKMHGRILIYYAGYKKHVSMYPAPRTNANFSEELRAYKGGKATVQFPLNKPLPAKLITRIVQFRMQEFASKAAIKKR